MFLTQEALIAGTIGWSLWRRHAHV